MQAAFLSKFSFLPSFLAFLPLFRFGATFRHVSPVNLLGPVLPFPDDSSVWLRCQNCPSDEMCAPLSRSRHVRSFSFSALSKLSPLFPTHGDPNVAPHFPATFTYICFHLRSSPTILPRSRIADRVFPLPLCPHFVTGSADSFPTLPSAPPRLLSNRIYRIHPQPFA